MKLIKSVPGFIMLVVGVLMMLGCFIWLYYIAYGPVFRPLFLIIAGALFITGIILTALGWRKSV